MLIEESFEKLKLKKIEKKLTYKTLQILIVEGFEDQKSI